MGRFFPVPSRWERIVTPVKRNVRSRRSGSGVCQGEIMEPVFLVPWNLTRGGEERQEQITEMLGANTVKVVLSFPSRLDQSRDAEKGQMMTDGGLALTKTLADVGHVQFTVLGPGQVKEDSQPGLIAE